MTTSTIGFIARARPTPDCRLPEVPDVVLAASVAPGVTTSTDVIVVLAPPGRVDVNVDVLGDAVVLALEVVVVASVESGVLVVSDDAEVVVVVCESVCAELVGVVVEEVGVSEVEVEDGAVEVVSAVDS